MNSSITLKINPRFVNSGNDRSLAEKLAALAKTFLGVEDAGAECVSSLMAKAAKYDSTQPSFAADLREAAMAHEARTLARRFA
jgi:hypothetical protein